MDEEFAIVARTKEAVESVGGPSEVARRLSTPEKKVQQSAISALLNPDPKTGKPVLRSKYHEQIAGLAGWRLEYMLRGELPKFAERTVIKPVEPSFGEVEVTPYRNPVAAGVGELREHDDKEPPRFLKLDLLPPGFAGPLVLAWVKGDSMEPDIPDGAPIVIDTGTRRLVSGMVFAFHTDDGPVVKKLVRKGPMWQAVSINPSGRTWLLAEQPIIIGWVITHLAGKL